MSFIKKNKAKTHILNVSRETIAYYSASSPSTK